MKGESFFFILFKMKLKLFCSWRANKEVDGGGRWTREYKVREKCLRAYRLGAKLKNL